MTRRDLFPPRTTGRETAFGSHAGPPADEDKVEDRLARYQHLDPLADRDVAQPLAAPQDCERTRRAHRVRTGPEATLDTSVTGGRGHTYLDTDGAAAYLGLPRSRALADLRRGGGGPKYVRIGARPVYRDEWLDEWAEANAVTSTSAEAARKRA
jgi:hypothetical protein